MTLENIIIIILIFIVILTGLVLSFFFIKREMLLHKRSKINYENYPEFKQFFELSISYKFIIFTAIHILLVIIMCCVIINNDALIPYIVLLIFDLGLVIIGCYSYFSSIKFNRDLKPYDEFYDNIASSYNNKNNIIKNIDTVENKIQAVSSEINKVQSKLRSLVIGFNGLSNINECVLPLQKIKKEQEDILNQFDNKVPELFTKSLVEYLKNGGVVNAQTYIFNPNKDLDLEPIMTAISNNLKSKYLNCVKDSYLNLKHTDASALLEMLDILKKFNLYEEQYIDVLLKAINKQPSKSSVLITYLFDNKHINYELIKKCLTLKSDWIFDYPLAGHISNNELTTLVADIIKINNINITNKFVMFADKSSSEFIKNGINIAALNNESSIVMSRYLELLELDGTFVSPSNKYENIALTLKTYYRTNGVTNSKVDNIISDSNFFESKKYLDDTYNQIIGEIEPLLMKTFRTMLYFTLYCSNVFTYFSQQKINTMYVEYKRKLNVTGLLCLTSLLDAIMLATLTDAKAVNVIIANVDCIKGFKQYDLYYPITSNKANKSKLYGNDLIQNLFRNHKNELSTLVNHIESERLVLDKIRFL